MQHIIKQGLPRSAHHTHIIIARFIRTKDNKKLVRANHFELLHDRLTASGDHFALFRTVTPLPHDLHILRRSDAADLREADRHFESVSR